MINSFIACLGLPVPPVPTPLLPTVAVGLTPDTEKPLDLSGPQAHAKEFFQTQSKEKKSRFLSKKAVSILQQWYQKHRDHPYATDEEVKELAAAGGIAPNQVNILTYTNLRPRPIKDIAIIL